jgi:hypothetical protein
VSTREPNSKNSHPQHDNHFLNNDEKPKINPKAPRTFAMATFFSKDPHPNDA